MLIVVIPTWCVIAGPPSIPPKLQDRHNLKSRSFLDKTNTRPAVSRTPKGIQEL